MQYFRIDAKVDAPAMGRDGPEVVKATLVDILQSPRLGGRGDPIPPVWQDPHWRKDAAHAEAFIEAYAALGPKSNGGKYVGLSDETFEVARALLTFAGLPLPPELMPLVHQVLRATKVKPDDFEEPVAEAAE